MRQNKNKNQNESVSSYGRRLAMLVATGSLALGACVPNTAAESEKHRAMPALSLEVDYASEESSLQSALAVDASPVDGYAVETADSITMEGLSQIDDQTHVSVESYDGKVDIEIDASKIEVPEGLKEDLLPNVVKITAVSEGGQYLHNYDGYREDDIESYGSGFIIDDERSPTGHTLVSAGHVFHQASEITAQDSNGSVVRTGESDVLYTDIIMLNRDGTLSRYDADDWHDIALAPVVDPSENLASLRVRNLEQRPMIVGEPVFMLNYQEGREPGNEFSSFGVYVGDNPYGDTMTLIGDIDPVVEEDRLLSGGSGGVLVDFNGEVVGITVAGQRIDDDQDRGYGCDLLEVDEGMAVVNSVFSLNSVLSRVAENNELCLLYTSDAADD